MLLDFYLHILELFNCMQLINRSIGKKNFRNIKSLRLANSWEEVKAKLVVKVFQFTETYASDIRASLAS